jgi:hypothetical protein
MKVVNMNWGRSQDEIDACFLTSYNQLRTQSLMLMN